MTMLFALLIPVILQGAAMFVDEAWFHQKRGLPRWERIGHPIDTLTTAACYAWLVATRPDQSFALPVYIALSALSCLVITKDEFVHARLCTGGEHWVHAVLFILHPLVFAAFGLIWARGLAPWLLPAMLGLMIAYAAYQFFYWRWWWRHYPAR
jgi:hypothetical protein